MTAKPKVCAHHWDIEPAQGMYSNGTCRHCGSVRAFRNELDLLDENTALPAKKAKGPSVQPGQFHLSHLQGRRQLDYNRDKLAQVVQEGHQLLAEGYGASEAANRLGLTVDELTELMNRYPATLAQPKHG